jgi:serine/threonine-protein kinase
MEEHKAKENEVSLREYTEDSLPAIDEVISLAHQIAAELKNFHHSGIIHQDLSPDSIFIDPNGKVRVSEPRLSLRPLYIEEQTGCRSHADAIDYIAPEWHMFLPITAQADIYSLGVLIYELLTRHMPFSADSLTDKIVSSLEDDPALPTEYRQDCPILLADVVMKCIAREVGARYETLDEALTALNQSILN